jgi:hypothetical protein
MRRVCSCVLVPYEQTVRTRCPAPTADVMAIIASNSRIFWCPVGRAGATRRSLFSST